MDNIYLVMLRRYDSVYGYEYNDLVKVFKEENDANSLKNSLNTKLETIVKNIKTQEFHCDMCDRDNCTGCEDVEQDYMYLTLEDGEEIKIDCDPWHGEDPEFYTRKVKVN